jgi:hypothetical protein
MVQDLQEAMPTSNSYKSTVGEDSSENQSETSHDKILGMRDQDEGRMSNGTGIISSVNLGLQEGESESHAPKYNWVLNL